MPAVPDDAADASLSPTALGALARAYGFASPIALTPFGPGRIHRSYRLVADGQSWLVQRLNTDVFSNLSALARNIEVVTTHLASTAPAARPLADGRPRPHLTLRSTVDGAPLLRDDDGDWWRIYRFIDGTAPMGASGLDQVCGAATCFGEFLRLCADLPPSSLALTIPHFHDTPRRYEALCAAVAKDEHGRADACGEAIAFAEARAPLAGRLHEWVADGAVPTRVVHNDCKLDNVLFAPAGGEALCVVDLDTVMPGLVWHDVGDLIRSAAASGDEQCDGLAIDLQRFESVIRGYLTGTGDLLTHAEVTHLAEAGQVITYELALRFLTDHLEGDRYFRVARVGENLERARRQFALLASMEREAPLQAQIVERVANEVFP